MGENENTSSGATDTSSVTAISVKVVVDTTTAELKKQFKGVQDDIAKDPIGLTFGVDAKTSKDAIIKGLQAILGKDNNINIGASVDQNAGKKVQQGVQNAVNAGQQAANKNKVKVRVETDADAKGAKLDAFYRRVKEIGSLRATFQSKLSSGASSTELQGLYKQLKESKDEATELYKELQKVISVDDYSKLREIGRTQSRATDKANFSGAGNFEKELRTRAESRLASMKKQEQSAMVKSETADVKKAISAFDSELTKYKKLSVDQKNLQLKKSTHELPYVSSLIDSSKEKLRNLHKTLVDILPEDQLNEVLDRYAGFEEELQEKLRRAEEHYNDLNKALNDKKATAAEKEQAKQSITLTDNLADAKSKYSTDKLSGAGDIQDALSKVQGKVNVLNTLKVGTKDYAAALKEANDEWANAKRLIDEFNTAQKNTENHVKNMTEQAAKWKESIKDSDTASQELRDSIDGIIDASKKLDSDHSSDAYKQGVKDLDDAFISAKASMSVYTDGYKNLESTAAKTLTEIRKKQLELQQAGNKSFDGILSGSGDGSADGGFESQFNYLKSLNSQSAEYKKVLESIVEEWKKTKLQIEQALKSEEDLANEGKRQLKDVQDARGKLQSLRNEVNQKGQLHNTNLHNYVNGKDGNGGQFSEIENMINTTDASRGTAEFEANLEALKNKLKEVKQAIIEYKQSFQNSDAMLQERNNLKELIAQITAYKEKLVGLKPDSSIARQFDEITKAAEQSQTSFEYSSKEIRSWFYNIQSDCRDAKLEVETLGQKLSRLFKEHFQTAIAMAGVAMVKQGLREVYNNVLDIDTALTELRKVSSMTSSEMNDFLDRSAVKARELGVSISDLVNSTADWKRLGYTDDDAEELARISSLMVNVGDGIQSIDDASSYLISTMQGFGLAADEAERLLDCMNQIANTEPVSMNDLGLIMQRSSAAMAAAGNTYQETLSMAAAVNGVLQSPETSGTYLKTLSMYLRAAKTEATNAGLEVDGMANSVSELRTELKQLSGVDIMKDNNTFKSTYQIMKELSEVWDNLTDTTQANITELISGKRGGQSTAALLSNFSVAEDSMKQALESSGSAMRENEQYMQSLQAKINQLDAAFQQLSKDLLSSDVPKFFVSLATGAVDLADGAVKAAGALPTLTAAISGVLSVMQMSGKLKNGAGKVNMPSYICCV